MTVTIIGQLADSIGLVCQRWLEPGRNHPQLRRSYSAAPAGEYRSRQPRDIRLELDHGRTIGHVRHLERAGGNLWVVAELDAPPSTIPPSAVYLSPTIDYQPQPDSTTATDIELRSVSLVSHPATAGAHAVHELSGDLRAASRQVWRLRDPFLTSLLEHARDSKLGTASIHERHHPGPVPTVDGYIVPTRPSGRWMEQPDGSLEWRDRHIAGVH